MGAGVKVASDLVVKFHNLVIKQCELHACLRFVMRLCRWAGVFPVEGLDKKSISRLRFNLRTPYVVYHVATLVYQSVLTCLSTYYLFVTDLDLHNLTNLLFYSTSWLSSMFLLKLARNWPKLMKKARYIEGCVAAIRTKKNIYRRNNRVASIIMILALFEHILSVIFKYKLAIKDYLASTSSGTHYYLEVIQVVFTRNAPYIFGVIQYNEWIALISELATIQATFLWNFTDAMTMCVSIYLISYFKDLNHVIETQEKQKIINWKEVRVYYSHLVELVHEVDSNMCYLILLSFFTNVFFICVQLFYLMNVEASAALSSATQHVMSPEFGGKWGTEYLSTRFPLPTIFPYNDPAHLLYYSYSFLFLFIRATVTSLMAANINTVACVPILVLQNVSPSEYNADVQRFIRQIRYTTTALSGLYFYITRGMILTVIGTVIKYELVLLQFKLRSFEA